MKWSLLLLTLLCGSGPLPAQRAQPSFKITGLVLNARDDSPMRHAHVTASLVAGGRGGPHEPIRTETDQAGRFNLEVSSAGNWQVSVTAHNFRPQSYLEHEGYFSGVILTSTIPVYDLVFRAVPDALLAGTITDEVGEPVRNAQILLFEVTPNARQTGGQPLQQKQGTQTDDLGHYEFPSLAEGRYIVQVQARPWYAGGLLVPRPGTRAAPLLDPSLDVVYPITWYPGGPDVSSENTLTAHPGDTLQADIRLQPEPSAHLVLPGTAISQRTGRDGGTPDTPRPFRGNPSISLLLANGTTQPVFGQFSEDAHGNIEIGGLAPGTYQVMVPGGPDSSSAMSIVQLRAGGTLTDLAAPQPTTPVTISVDGDSKVRASEIVLRSTLTGQAFPDMPRERRELNLPSDGETQRTRRNTQAGVQGRPGSQPPGPGGRSRVRSTSDAEEATLQVPPGQYVVGTSGDPNTFLTGASAKGAVVVGKTVTISESPAHLTVHLGAGFAVVQGSAVLDGTQLPGAMVLLVPATMGDPASLTSVQRDQTNTDGSFRIEHVVPGAYILVAIDRGWTVRWNDPDTLRPYLLRGTPLDVHSSATINQKLIALPR